MLKSFSNYVADRKKGPQVKEYLDDQGKLVEKPKVKVVADYDGPDPKTPPKAKGAEEGAPYRCANSAEKPKKGENGFADLGDKKLVYDPDMAPGTSKLSALGKEVGNDWPKTKTENFIQATKKMSSGEFAKYMLESCACDKEALPKVAMHEGRPYPSDALRYVAALTSQNVKIMENFVHEMRKSNQLSVLLAVMLEHRETYDALVALLEDEEFGPTRAKFFARSLSEAVGPPMGLGDDEEDEMPPEEGEEENMPPEEGDEEGDEGHPPFGDEDEEGEEGDEEDMPPEEGDEEGEEGHPPFGDEEDDEHPMDKLGPPKKKFNLGSAMGSFESVKQALRAYINA